MKEPILPFTFAVAKGRVSLISDICILVTQTFRGHHGFILEVLHMLAWRTHKISEECL